MNKILIFLVSTIFLLFSCAEQIPPSGGVKDTTPPKVLFYYPENYTTNFHYDKIEIKFDEFIKFNSSLGNIIISPIINKQPKFELLGKKIIITFQEMLQKNTTYIINFGNSIQDYNEGNELKNFKYVFSTGRIIDSLSIDGRVINAFDNKPIENVIVGLYSKYEDSVLFKKPLYFTKTNNLGQYKIENIKEGAYIIACLEDKNLNYIFDQASEKIGFIDSVFVLKKNLSNKNISLFEDIQEEKILDYNNDLNNLIVFNFNKPFLKLSLDVSNYQNKDVFYHSLDKKHFYYWYVNRDSLITTFIFNQKDSICLFLKENTKSFPFNFDLSSNFTDNKTHIFLDFPFPIKDIDKSKIKLLSKKNPLSINFNWINNHKTLQISTEGKEDSLVLLCEKGVFTSFHNLISLKKIDTISITESNFSNLNLNFKSSENLIIELYNNQEELVNMKNVSRETNITFNSLKKGKYFIRVYRDANKDYIWNSGLFHVKQQAEKTLLYKEIKIKDNWDVEYDLEF